MTYFLIKFFIRKERQTERFLNDLKSSRDRIKQIIREKSE